MSKAGRLRRQSVGDVSALLGALFGFGTARGSPPCPRARRIVANAPPRVLLTPSVRAASCQAMRCCRATGCSRPCPLVRRVLCVWLVPRSRPRACAPHPQQAPCVCGCVGGAAGRGACCCAQRLTRASFRSPRRRHGSDCPRPSRGLEAHGLGGRSARPVSLCLPTLSSPRAGDPRVPPSHCLCPRAPAHRPPVPAPLPPPPPLLVLSQSTCTSRTCTAARGWRALQKTKSPPSSGSRCVETTRHSNYAPRSSVYRVAQATTVTAIQWIEVRGLRPKHSRLRTRTRERKRERERAHTH